MNTDSATGADGAIRSALARCRRHFVTAAAFSALLNILYIAPTLYMLQVYDRVVPTQGVLTLAFLTLALVIALLLLSQLDRLRMRLLVKASVMLDVALAPAILDSMLGRPERPAARQAIRDFDTMRQTLTGAGVLALFDVPWTPVYILVCFLVHPWIGVLALAGGILLPLIAWRNEVATHRGMERAQFAAATSHAALDTTLQAADTVKALGMRRAVVARQLRQRQTAMMLNAETGFTAGTYLSATKFVRLALQSLALGLGALLAIDNLISAGAIFASSFLIARALQPIEQIVAAWKSLMQSRVAYHSIAGLLADDAGRDRTQLPAPQGGITVEGVTVSNLARPQPILDSVGFAVAPGQIVAIVGASGAGKSTLLRALAGAQPVDGGTIRLDGADRNDWDPEKLGRHIGYLPQETALLGGTVKENIARFATELSGETEEIDAAVIRAATMVGAHELILQLPGGYDYPLAAGGRGLSAGQAQRIGLARAVFGDPNLLLLDEPNAHLDAEGDAQLVTALTKLKAEGTTILVISHKPAIMPVVDRMLVIRDGKVAIFGSRDEVMAQLAPPRPRPVTQPVQQATTRAVAS